MVSVELDKKNCYLVSSDVIVMAALVPVYMGSSIWYILQKKAFCGNYS